MLPNSTNPLIAFSLTRSLRFSDADCPRPRHAVLANAMLANAIPKERFGDFAKHEMVCRLPKHMPETLSDDRFRRNTCRLFETYALVFGDNSSTFPCFGLMRQLQIDHCDGTRSTRSIDEIFEDFCDRPTCGARQKAISIPVGARRMGVGSIRTTILRKGTVMGLGNLRQLDSTVQMSGVEATVGPLPDLVEKTGPLGISSQL